MHAAPRSAILARLPALLGVALLLACDPSEGGASRADRSAAVPVIVAAAVSERVVDRIEALGTARANESVTLTARVTETLSAVSFEDGASVSRGDVIAELVSAEEAAALSQARSGLQEARRQHRRTEELFREGSATQARRETAQAARDGARARVEELEARLADRLIRAPFDGVLGLRLVSPGALLQPGDAITTLDDVDPMKLDFSVPERLLARLAPGQHVDARSEAYPERTFRGEVAAVDSRVNPRTRSVAVRALIDNPERLLRPGMLLVVELQHSPREALVVPEAALVPLGAETFTYVIDAEGRAQRVAVRAGQRRAGLVEIVDGLAAGDRVVVEGTQRVRPGVEVEVLDPERADVDL